MGLGEIMESKLQTQCNDFLRDAGILFYHREKGRRSKQKAHSKGFPDLAIWHNGVSIFIELKSGSNDLSDDQREWRDRAYQASVNHYVIYSFDQFLNILEFEGFISE